MFPRAWIERIRDILDAMAEIETFTQGMDFDAFRNDPKTLRAVELDFITLLSLVRQHTTSPRLCKQRTPRFPGI